MENFLNQKENISGSKWLWMCNTSCKKLCNLCLECSTCVTAHTEGPAWFVMCNMCNDDWNIDHRRWSKRCLLTTGDQNLKKILCYLLRMFTKSTTNYYYDQLVLTCRNTLVTSKSCGSFFSIFGSCSSCCWRDESLTAVILPRVPLLLTS